MEGHATEPGLRERKKQQTRAAIAVAALRLFTERGFDAVTVAEVARAADVSVGTVFNYFPAKEDLFFGQMEVFEAALVDAVRARAFGQFVLSRSKQLSTRTSSPRSSTRPVPAPTTWRREQSQVR